MSLFLLTAERRGNKVKKDTAKLLWERLSALSISSIAECSKPFISVTFCQQGNQCQWNAAGFLYGHVMQPFQRMLRCTVHTRASEFMRCFQMLWNRQGSMMNRQRQPCCQSKVNSLSIEEGKWPPGPAHRSRKQQLKCNCFWLCLRAYRTPALCASLLFVWILILSFDTFLCLRKISLGELALPSLKLETETRLHFG